MAQGLLEQQFYIIMCIIIIYSLFKLSPIRVIIVRVIVHVNCDGRETLKSGN